MTLFRHRVAEQILSSSIEHIAELPEIERAILDMVLSGASQPTIARGLGISQPTVSYRVSRALWRLEMLWLYPRVTEEDVREAVRASEYPVRPPQHPPTGYVPGYWSRTSESTLVKGIHAYLRTTSQIQGAVAVGHSQGWLRHQATKLRKHLRARKDEIEDEANDAASIWIGARVVTTPWDSVLAALEMLAEHKNLFPPRHERWTLAVEAPTAQDVWDRAVAAAKTPVPAPYRDRRVRVTGEEELQMIVDFLRANGPVPRPAAIEMLEWEGHDPDRVIRAALRKKRIFRRQGKRVGTRASTMLIALPQAATSQRASFQIDWEKAVREFCAAYDSFRTRDVTRHLGMGTWRDRVALRENLPLIKDLVRASGFEEKDRDEWARAPEPEKAEPRVGDAREDFHEQIIEVVSQGGVLRRREIEQKVEATRSQMDLALRKLVEGGRLVRMGSGASTVYMSPRNS